MTSSTYYMIVHNNVLRAIVKASVGTGAKENLNLLTRGTSCILNQ